MTNIAAAGISTSAVNLLTTAKPTVRKLSAEEQARLEQMWQDQFKVMADPSQADNAPNNIYATVKVNGKTVATIYNSGGMMTSNADAGKCANIDSVKNPQGQGPQLAQQRADDIAKKLGGTVEKSSTAQTQSQWLARPPVEYTYDTKAMAAAQERMATRSAADQKALDADAKTKTDAQLLGQGQASTGDAAVDNFMKFMDAAKDGIGAFMRAQILASKGLTEDDVAKMAPEDQEKLEAEIRDEIQKKIEEARQKEVDKVQSV